MLPIRGLYEVAVPVKDLPRAETFYRDVLGLEEVFHAWMPATSVYFSDPDGHQLELCAPIPEPQTRSLQ